jgi:hypothetical protein
VIESVMHDYIASSRRWIATLGRNRQQRTNLGYGSVATRVTFVVLSFWSAWTVWHHGLGTDPILIGGVFLGLG